MAFERAIVVGASSGIGAELVRQLAANGTKVVGLARRANKIPSSPTVTAVEHDVRAFDTIPSTFEEAVKTLGGLDVIYYCSGVMPIVAPGEFSFEKDQEMIEVNYLGGVAWLNEAAMYFRKTGPGSIVGIGSVAGDRGRAGQPGYNSSKAGFHTYLESLRNRLNRHGICVVTIKPGPTSTEMTAHMNQAKMMSVEVAATKIIALSTKPGEYYLKLVHKIIFAIIKAVPSPIFRKLNI